MTLGQDSILSNLCLLMGMQPVTYRIVPVTGKENTCNTWIDVLAATIFIISKMIMKMALKTIEFRIRKEIKSLTNNKFFKLLKVEAFSDHKQNLVQVFDSLVQVKAIIEVPIVPN